MRSKPKVSYEVCNLQAYGMKDPLSYCQTSPATFTHNLPPEVLLPLQRNTETAKKATALTLPRVTQVFTATVQKPNCHMFNRMDSVTLFLRVSHGFQAVARALHILDL